MMKKLYLFLFVLVFSAFFAFAEEKTETVHVLKKTSPKLLSVTTDFQWVSGINQLDTPGISSSSMFGKVHVGAKYIFSEIAYFTANFPFGFFYTEGNYSALGANPSQSVTNFVTDRVKVGVEGKLFRETMLGEISWNSQAYLPTIFGTVPSRNRFYNHTDLSVGLSNSYRFSKLPLFALGSFSYITKFSSVYQKEEKDYGDEFSASFGAAYSITPKLTPVLRFQGSYVMPSETIINKISIPATGSALAVHAVPGFSIPLDNNISIRGHSRVLLYRTQVDNQDSGELWGNFEDESRLSILLGIRFGIL